MDWKQEVFKRLDVLAEKLGVAAGHLWQILVKQAYAEGVGGLVIAGMCFAIVAAGIWAMRKAFKINDDDLSPALFGGGGVCGLIALFIGSFNLYDGVLRLINPEYYALQKILEVLK